SKHFDKDLVEKVYAKNRVSASVFEILTVSIFFSLGIFSSYEMFEVPAAASVVLLFTICLMLFSALHSWLRGWVYAVFIVILFSMDYLSVKTGMFNYTSYAYGLNYETAEKSPYSIQRIIEISNREELNKNSLDAYIETLNNWKKNTGQEKPKMVLLNTSGGGSRSALWTVTVMQKIDKILSGKVSRHTQLITGASGGMIGAAYYRELLLRKNLNEISDIYTTKYRDKISMDMLNKLTFMGSTNDILIRYQKLKINGFKYTKDRGYAFEEQLHKNTGGILDHDLGYYKPYEQQGIIPTMIFTPTIINDGRRLFISAQSMNFITSHNGSSINMPNSNENIDYHSLLDNQKTNEIRFSSVLRASATFPFVMPMITLPTKPETQLMDAGIRDNYGGKTIMEFLFAVKDWIEENTSGVIILQVRDTKKIMDDESHSQVSFLDKITLPFGNMYKNFPRVQDFNQDELMNIGVLSFEFPVNIVSFNLLENKRNRISLSWHLTSQEKRKIHKAFNSPGNQQALDDLRRLLN
ncbi:MAG: patatin-like phospholipase family protein, partial [Crocinitomicaceae bacterium]|nr:patatin-like phospholipase family protein [Crocinitomicaceae bacterium]